MRAGLPVSVIAHVGVLAWGLLSLPSAHPVDASSLEMIPVDFVQISDETQLIAGLQTAALVEEVTPPMPTPAPEPPPLPRPAPQPPPQPEPPPPVPEPPPPLPTPEPPAPAPEPPAPAAAPEPAPPPAPAPEAPPPPPEAAPEPKPLTNVPMPRIRPERPVQQAARPVEPPPPQTPATPTPAEPEFDVDKLTAMLDQMPDAEAQQPAAQTSPVEPPPQQAALGAPTGATGVTMTLSELDALRSALSRCWSPPIGYTDPAQVRVVMLISLNPDGSVAGTQVAEAPAGQFARQAPESTIRAVRLCAPYNLPVEKYDTWRELKITFDPRDMGLF